MTSNIHVGNCNLLVKLTEIKFSFSRKFEPQNLSLVATSKRLSMQNFKILEIFDLAKLSTVLQKKISKLVNLNSIFFENFPCASRMSKLL